MDTQLIRAMGIELLMQEKIKRKDVVDYVKSVNNLADAYDADDKLQKAFENGMKQIDHIFELRKRLMESVK